MTHASKTTGTSTPLPPLETSFFNALFGECCRGPEEEGELKVEEPEVSPKKKKEKKSRGNKDLCIVAGSAGERPKIDAKATSTLSSSGAREDKTHECSRPYRIDNSILKIKNRPGLAFRLSKRDADKVRGEVGPAKWGDIVEGLDEGDGWLKVGAYFLPMKYQGIPVVALVGDETEQAASPAAAKPETAGATSAELAATKSSTRSTCQVSGKEEEGKSGAAELSTDVTLPEGFQAGGASAKEEPMADTPSVKEQPKAEAASQEERGSADSADVAAPPAAEDESSLVTTEDFEAEAAALQGSRLEESGAEEELQESSVGEEFAQQVPALKQEQQQQQQQQQCAWYTRPSVGTWLQAHPQPKPAEPAAAVAALLREEQRDSTDRRDETKVQPPAAINWALLPSVATWHCRRLPASAQRAPKRALSSHVQMEEGTKATDAAAALAPRQPLLHEDSKMPGECIEFDQKEPWKED